MREKIPVDSEIHCKRKCKSEIHCKRNRDSIEKTVACHSFVHVWHSTHHYIHKACDILLWYINSISEAQIYVCYTWRRIVGLTQVFVQQILILSLGFLILQRSIIAMRTHACFLIWWHDDTDAAVFICCSIPPAPTDFIFASLWLDFLQTEHHFLESISIYKLEWLPYFWEDMLKLPTLLNNKICNFST